MGDVDAQSVIALAATIQGIATLVLVAVTIWYVRLTRELVRAAQADLRDARELVHGRRVAASESLVWTARHMLQCIKRLPAPNGMPVDRVREAMLWTLESEEVLRTQSQVLGVEYVALVGGLLPALTWMRDFRQRIRDTNPGHGFRKGRQDDENYANSYRIAMQDLPVLIERLETLK